jgi:hypothetical protein
MDSKEVFKAKIVNQLSKWKTTIDGLKTHIEQAEVDAKVKLHDQLEILHDKRVKAEKILEDISATSQDAWGQVKSGVEQGWTELTRTAKKTVARVREAIAKPKPDEEIRQIAYKLVARTEGAERWPDGALFRPVGPFRNAFTARRSTLSRGREAFSQSCHSDRHSGRKKKDPRNLSRAAIAQFLQRHSGKDLGQLPWNGVRAAGLAGHLERLGIAAPAHGSQARHRAPYPPDNAASAIAAPRA